MTQRSFGSDHFRLLQFDRFSRSMHLAIVLCLVPSLAERFHSHVKFQQDANADNLNPPDLAELQTWASFFRSSAGGGMYATPARDKAFRILKGNPPDLDEVKKWASFFRSSAGGGMYATPARDKAFQTLKEAHPDLDEVKKWASFFRSSAGGGMYATPARDKAFQTLKEAHPTLDEVKKWASFFRSPEGGGMYAAPARDKAFGILKGNPPDLDEVKKWASFFRSSAGGGMYATPARDKALNMLTKTSPTQPETKPDAASKPAEPTTTATTTPEMLDCDAPSKPQNGDPFGKICKEGLSGGKVRHGQRCTPVCRLGHAPQPASLTCDNGVIGSFECPEFIDPLQKACKDKCAQENKGYTYKVDGNGPSCECISAGTVLKPPF